MKRSWPCLLLFLLGSIAQSQTLADIDTSKYRIYLPDYWKRGNKVWRILSDKLPSLCEELKDKDLCGDNCNPKYTIELEVFEPIITDYDFYCINPASNLPYRYWIFLVHYNFRSSFLLVNAKRELITRIIFIDTTESYSIQRMETYNLSREVVYKYRQPNLNWTTRGSVTQRNQVPLAQMVSMYQYRDDFNPMSFIENNRKKLFPTDLELFTIIDNRIRSW